MRTRNQFSPEKIGEVLNVNESLKSSSYFLVENITAVYPKTSRLHKVAAKMLKTQQELSVLLAEEEGVVNGGTVSSEEPIAVVGS